MGTESRKGILRPGQTMADFMGLSVMNMSSLTLSADQTNALSKGLTFCPTPWEPDMSSIITNLEDFFRKMRLKAHFFKLELNAKEAAYLEQLKETKGKKGRKKSICFIAPSQSKLNTIPIPIPKHKPIWHQFRGKSTYNPPCTDDTLEAFCKNVKLDILKSPIKQGRWSNLSKQERMGLDTLQKDPEITIKKADKGSAIVVMNTIDYIFEVERQLSDTKSYISLPGDPTLSVVSEYKGY
jgi:hypothetical protein